MNQTLRVNKTNFPHERLCLWTRFETEGKGNSEMGYWMDGEKVEKKHTQSIILYTALN